MVREFQQNRRSDSLVILHLPKLAQFSPEEVETAVSLAATICVEQTRSSSGNHFLLGITAGDDHVISSRLPGGFRDDALDALAVCQPSTKADLRSLLTSLVELHPLGDDRIVLITPKPEEAATVLHDLSNQLLADHIDLVSRTTIVAADAHSMSQVFVENDGAPVIAATNAPLAGASA